MTYNTGTATGHLDLLDQLIEVITGRHMATAVINAGGTGHAVGDILTISNTGATQTETAKIEVVTLSGSAIATLRIYRGGVYTVDPTTITGNAQSATTGSGTGATFDITFDDTGWTQNARQSKAVTSDPTITAGGTGYAVSDILTLVGGAIATGGAAATFTVDSVSGGVITGISNTTVGDYESPPANPAASTNDGSGNNDATLTVTYENTTGEIVVVLQGDAGAETDPLVGIKTYSSENDETGSNQVFNWAVFGMAAYDITKQLWNQTNVSDGFSTSNDGNITLSTSGDGAFVPLKDTSGINIQWSIRATGRSVTMIARVEGASTVYYAQTSFGLLNQYGISTEFPLPAYVAGSSDRKKVWFRDTLSLWGGLTRVIQRNNGPFFILHPNGSWENVKNATIGTNTSLVPSIDSSNVSPRIQLWPVGEIPIHTTISDEIWDKATFSGFDNEHFSLASGAIQIYRTPDTGGDLFPLLPIVPVQASPTTDGYTAFGEVDGLWFISDNDAALTSGDRLTQGGVAYSIYQNGTQVNPYAFLALEES